MENRNGILPADIFTVFARLGFSKYEAMAYATLCACGRLKMRHLAKYSRVPQSKIYDVLGNLEIKGAVVISRVRPKTAESVPLKQIISAGVEQHLQDGQKVLEYVESIQNTEVFKHLYHTRRVALRSNGRLNLPFSGISPKRQS
ncbi:hypothetical protein KEJ39_09430 [Candidatus Bathyarchaeota archaeon]|nr:hypothetical protein [Candidatus Bathyarchaeota archaeon]